MASLFEDILEELEEMAEEAFNVPLSGGKCVVNGEELREKLELLRLNLPLEMKKASEICGERDKIIERAKRCREYFGRDGGITLSGGEPLLQPEFAEELFTLAKKEGINTCLDTSGVVLNDRVKALLSVTDRVLLDIKYTTDELYRHNVGCSIEAPLAFLEYLNEIKLPTTLRQVIIPTLNDTEENIKALSGIRDAHACVDTVELLPFRKICETKYKTLGIPFPDSHIPEPTHKRMEELYALLDL